MTGYLAILLFAVGLSLASEEVVLGPDSWAVLIAGSAGWVNYRHQADVCHAYQSLLQKGVKKERIITLMYDDIAQNDENPEKGIIINRPNGPDVYKDVFIDYKGEEVTVKNFLSILKGEESALKNVGSGRVLKSTENDTVFINFADHGGAGVLGFPNEILYVNDLIATLDKMDEINIFGKLILYVEACEAGSMFDNLINHLDNVFVSTASAADESSYGWYCKNETYGTCLGDLYSITWMERLDEISSDANETLFDNYNAIRSKVKKSHVNLYGDYRLGFVKQFTPTENKNEFQPNDSVFYEESDGIDSRDVPLLSARMELEAAKTSGNLIAKQNKLRNMIRAREFADRLISRILEVYFEGDKDLQSDLESSRDKLNLDMFPCYRELVDSFETNCFRIPRNTYFMKHLYKLANICLRDVTTNKAVTAIRSVCEGQKETINNIGINIE